MHELKNEEMQAISGGADPLIITAAITGIITFITGILQGYSNPRKCNN